MKILPLVCWECFLELRISLSLSLEEVPDGVLGAFPLGYLECQVGKVTS